MSLEKEIQKSIRANLPQQTKNRVVMSKVLTEVKIQQTIGQLEASIDKAEKHLAVEEFKDYCDSMYSCIAYWKVILKCNRNRIEENINPLLEE